MDWSATSLEEEMEGVIEQTIQDNIFYEDTNTAVHPTGISLPGAGAGEYSVYGPTGSEYHGCLLIVQDGWKSELNLGLSKRSNFYTENIGTHSTDSTTILYSADIPVTRMTTLRKDSEENKNVSELNILSEQGPKQEDRQLCSHNNKLGWTLGGDKGCFTDRPMKRGRRRIKPDGLIQQTINIFTTLLPKTDVPRGVKGGPGGPKKHPKNFSDIEGGLEDSFSYPQVDSF
jgi:hypothetical protein